MTGPLRDWDRFFFEPRTARVLGLYRIVIGLLTLYSFLLFAKDAGTFFSNEGVLRLETLEKVNAREWHSLLRWVRSPLGVNLLLGALFVAAVSFTVGFRTRLSAIALFILVASFHERNNLVLNSGDTVLRTMLFLFMFAPAGSALSFDRLRQRVGLPEGTALPPVRVLPWAQRMMQLQVALIYVTTAYAKTRGDLYHTGAAMYYISGLIDFNVRGVETLMNYPVLYSALTFGMLFFEIAIPFLIWFRATRPYAVAMGILLHLWIMACMILPVFGILMIATYLCFFSEEEFERAVEWLKHRYGGTRLGRALARMPERLVCARWFLWLSGRRG